MFAQYRTDQTVFEQRVYNIRFEDPPEGVVDFSVPGGFATHITCWSISTPTREAVQQTYRPGQDLCVR